MRLACQRHRPAQYRWKARLEAETKVLVAQIGAQLKADTAQGDGADKPAATDAPDTGAALAAAMQGFTQALQEMRQPRTIMRGPDGRAQGIM